MTSFVQRSRMPVGAAQAFAWHARSGALERLAPPWERLRVLRQSGGLAPGAEVEFELRAGPLRQRWLARHTALVPGARFADEQVHGPFARWHHEHQFLPRGAEQSILEDRVEYALPFGAFGQWLAGAWVEERLQRLFRYRHATTAADLAAHERGVAMRIAVSGASGLVGSALVPFLSAGGHELLALTRGKSGAGRVNWNPSAGSIDAAALEGLDGVVHLAGENIAGGRWNAARKAEILASRVRGTRLLCETLAALEHKPRVLVAASAIGIYGERGDELLDERSAAGSGFLSEVCTAWEQACEPARAAGIRVLNLRIGIVLSPRGGALARMLPPFRMGLGGRLGSGRQYMSWIAIDDLVGAIHRGLTDECLSGAVNAVAPGAVTNAEFTRVLARVLGRPAWLPAPAFGLRLALGEMADALLLASTRVAPARLAGAGYAFRHPQLEGALRHLLGR